MEYCTCYTCILNIIYRHLIQLKHQHYHHQENKQVLVVKDIQILICLEKSILYILCSLTNPPPLPPTLKSTTENLIPPDFIRKWHSHDSKVSGIEFCKDNSILITCSEDNSAKIWNLDVL